MEKSCRTEFEKGILGLAEMFKEVLSDVQLNGYWIALGDMTFEDFERVTMELLRSNVFMPKPVEFLERIGASVKTEASLAYGKVEKAFTKAGADKSVIFDDPVIHAVIDNLGGWVKYCQLPEKEITWWRKDFEAAYVGFAPLVAQGRIIPPVKLVGLYEGQGNIEARCKEPIYIGDGGGQVKYELTARQTDCKFVRVPPIETPIDYEKGQFEAQNILKNLGVKKQKALTGG